MQHWNPKPDAQLLDEDDRELELLDEDELVLELLDELLELDELELLDEDDELDELDELSPDEAAELGSSPQHSSPVM